MLVKPQHFSSLLGIHLSPPSTIIRRLFGSRDLVLGCLLFSATSNLRTASSKVITEDGVENEIKEQDRRFELKGVLWVGLVIDVIDMLSSLLEVWDGREVWDRRMRAKPIAVVAGKAALSLLLTMVGLRNL